MNVGAGDDVMPARQRVLRQRVAMLLGCQLVIEPPNAVVPVHLDREMQRLVVRKGGRLQRGRRALACHEDRPDGPHVAVPISLPPRGGAVQRLG